jgi:hypothetical protein
VGRFQVDVIERPGLTVGFRACVDDPAAAQGWIAVTATVNGARIRSRPVDGPVLGTIGYGAGFWVSCTRGASDGHAWGWSYRGGTYGWVRGDLWEVEQHTGPGGGGTPQVPRCP